MNSKNFKRESIQSVSRMPDTEQNVTRADDIKAKFDLRTMDSKVVSLIEDVKKQRKELFDKGLFKE
jgi:hypothetical protein